MRKATEKGVATVPKWIDWDLKCPDCGFEFSIGFPIDETEENKKEIRSCPCGSEMAILRESRC